MGMLDIPNTDREFYPDILFEYGPIEYRPDGAIAIFNSGIIHAESDQIVDVFLVGGGGAGRYGGGGGGYTKLIRGVSLRQGESYEIVIGQGGKGSINSSTWGEDGGKTEAFGYAAEGGGAAGPSTNEKTRLKGGNGGSGGGAGASSDYGTNCGNGGSNGMTGSAASGSTGAAGGTGQGYTTRVFEEEFGELFAAGGGGCPKSSSNSIGIGGEGGGGNGSYTGRNVIGAPNTGSGGGGTWASAASVRDGGNGILFIRRHKPVNEILNLYTPGDRHTGITGDWVGIKRDPTGNYTSTDRAPTIKPYDDHLYADNTGSYSGAVYTALKVDMTPYKTLVFEGEFKRSGSYGTGFMVGVWSTMTGNANGDTRLAYTQQVNEDKDVIFNRYEVDVSDVSGYGHVGINMANAYAKITACYLVKGDYTPEKWTYLCRSGDECEELTGGWVGNNKKSNSSSGATARAPVIDRTQLNCIVANNSTTYGGMFVTANQIDLTPYKEIVFEGEFLAVADTAQNVYVGAWSTIGTYYQVTPDAFEGSNGEATVRRFVVNVEELEGLYYVGVGLTRMKVTLNNCYLVPKDV